MAEATGPGVVGQEVPGGGGHFLAPREVMIVLPGLLLAILLAMLDNLIVSTALPRIVGDLGGVAHLSWVVTAYILASLVVTPFYGKLGDMYGRKRFFIVAIVIFLAGSALAGQSHSMAELIAFRAIQGLGAGGLMVGAMATLGDIVSPRERGKYMSYMMVVMMLATIGGPLVGGFITTDFSWRWIFYINLPVGGAALVYIITTLHLPAKRVTHKVDYLGGGLLAVAATALVLLATWGGTEYRWGSAQIIGLALLAVAATVAFCAVEMRVAEPILPLHVFKNRNFSLSMALTFLTGLAMFGAMTFLPLYQQTVQGESPTISGLALTPMMIGVTITSILAGQITTRTGRYKLFPILGGAIMGLGMYLLTHLGVGTTRLTSAIFYVVLGLGMGFLMQMVSLIAQNSVTQKDMGVASSARMFFQQIGGSLGVAAFGAIFARRLTESLAAAAGSGVHISASGGSLDPATVNSLPAAVKHDVFFAIAHAVQAVFVWALPASVLIFLLALLVKEVPLRGRAAPPSADEAASQQPELVS
ncbi:MAG TPA: MDR family MFS transporter [Streptosporangiaceae bacterium]|nr:MDR family MFS transporter [Streptosporangiaceae bacterium]